jgi:DNA-binding transcriptional ArsR family regulator
MTLSNDPADATADTFEDLQAIMEEPAGGENFGRTAVDPYLNFGDGRIALGVADAQERDLLGKGGWSIFDASHEGRRVGGSSHRGTLHPHEYVDGDALRADVEAHLGFSYDELHAVYSTGGRLADHLRDLRDRLDARLLEVSEAGANMDELARVTGVTPRTLDRALARARTETKLLRMAGGVRVPVPPSTRPTMLPEAELPAIVSPGVQREREAADALDFAVYGEDDHHERCLFAAEGGDACSRDYDVLPPSQEDSRRTGLVAPTPELWYAGGGIGALYGLPGREAYPAFDEFGPLVIQPRSFYADLAGWNVRRITTLEETPGYGD